MVMDELYSTAEYPKFPYDVKIVYNDILYYIVKLATMYSSIVCVGAKKYVKL